MQDLIRIKGANVHNLKNISLDIPKNKLVVITGLSGSGKSSLAFDTIYAEGQRRYAESLSAYARRFMDVQDKPDVESISGLSPTIAIDQKNYTQNPRSTVGTVTEIYDYLRLLFSRAGTQYCPDCFEKAESSTTGEIIEEARKLARKNNELLVCSPILKDSKSDIKSLLERIERSGMNTLRVDGDVVKINDLQKCYFPPDKAHSVEIITGRITDIKKDDVVDMVEKALDLSDGEILLVGEKIENFYTSFSFCRKCGRKMQSIDPRSFSFNSPFGACPRCTGLGVTMEVDPNLVIPNPRLSLSEGAIQPWTRITGNHNLYAKILSSVAQRHGFSVNMPASELPEKFLNIVLYGAGNDIYEIDGKKVLFAGVISDLTKRHLETDSEYVRKEIEQYMRERECSVCEGKRLKKESLAIKIGDFNITDITDLSIDDVAKTLKKININGTKSLNGKSEKIFSSIFNEIIPRLENLNKVGLGYLSLDRAMNTLSGGEATRVRLATQLSSGLTGVIYVLDEPSVGLHPRDNNKLIETLRQLRDMGNTVVVVEHDAAMMESADYIIDIGPGAGIYGGQIVGAGSVSDIKKSTASITGKYLSGKTSVFEDCGGKIKKSAKSDKNIEIVGAKAFNLKNIDVKIPLKKLICVTGVSGSGKSTLIINILSRELHKHFYRAKDEPGAHKSIKGMDNIDKVISVDQTPIGRTPRSNPATYTGIFTLIRDLYAALPESKMRGYDAGKFSFNVKGGGRCEACAGEGYVRIPMQFLSDVFVMCNDCAGSRYNQEVLEVHYKEKNIADVLNLTVEEACQFFEQEATLGEKLRVLKSVGLGYLTLGQPATTLSGGEAQRIKLASELSRVSTGSTLYILDEPTTGLHFEDIKHLLLVLKRLVEKGNTVLVVEHNLDVVKSSDWVVELGPEGGDKGGDLVFSGEPCDLKKSKKSWTAKYM
jgi:excinuclease ABC subunit A